MRRMFFYLLPFALLSCGVADFMECNIERLPDDEYGDIMVPADELFLFADLGGKRATKTKSTDGSQNMVSLESLLDRDAAEEMSFKSMIIRQIPFLDNKDDKKVMFRKNNDNSYYSDSLTVVRTVLIETVDTLTGAVTKDVATMIPYVGYVDMYGAETVSFLDKSLYRGIILYSDLYGGSIDIYTYGDGPIGDAVVVPFEDAGSYSSRLMYLSVPASVCTRADKEPVELEASYCIAEVMPEWDLYKDSEGGEYGGDDWRNDPPLDDGGGCGGGGGKPREPVKYTVSLSSSSGGIALGSGEYVKDFYVTCRAVSDMDFYFSRWVGSLRGYSECAAFLIRTDIEATAYFGSVLEEGKLPCWDKSTGVGNPLVEMSLAPTGRWNTNFIGSTFGNTRWWNGQKKNHSGIDLYAEPGTPLYAMCDGRISMTQKYVTVQPMRIGQDEYPAWYKGDTNGAGNRFSIECLIGGQVVIFSYWHLSADNPVAINPRTGRPFRPGDKVYRGEVIAYSGCTGNAYEVPYPHLHLTAQQNGKRVNPEIYLNGIVSRESNGAVRSTKITGIKCDEEDKIYLYYGDVWLSDDNPGMKL